MENHTDAKSHWERVYTTKSLEEVSWYQPIPQTSLDFFKEEHIPKDARILDVGGGDSLLVDHLLDLGYQNLSVLDISGAALGRAKKRLGSRADKVDWIEADVRDFSAEGKFDVWHDRAAFHFLSDQVSISTYVHNADQSIRGKGWLFMGTFSETGPLKCSGLETTHYAPEGLKSVFKRNFDNIRCVETIHHTPFGTSQDFTFCSFRKKQS